MSTRSRILLVGLGGTGHDCLIEAKRLFQKNEGRVPPYVKFLYFDTVPSKSQGEISLDPFESVVLSLRDPSEVLNDPENAYLRDWFPRNVTAQTAIHGAAQIRPLGRLALHSQPDFVLKYLDDGLAALTDKTRLRELAEGEAVDEQGSIEVYIFASLCGGTGSGILIDVAQLIKQQLRNAPSVAIYGIFLLPGPFRGLPGTAMVRPNAYATLKELDYLATPRTPIDFAFGAGRKAEITLSPFSLIYLIDNISERYDTANSLSHLAQQMAFLPYLMSTGSIGPYIRELMRNLIPQLESKPRVHGKRATYASFGVATLEIPPSALAIAKRELEIRTLNVLLEDTAEVQRAGDMGLAGLLAKSRSGHVPENLRMFLRPNFDSPRMPIGYLEETYADAMHSVESHARRMLADYLAGVRSGGPRIVQAVVEDASLHAGALSSALRELSRLEGDLNVCKANVGEPIRNAEIAEKAQSEAWDLCRKAYESRLRGRRRRAALDWQATVNERVLPVRLSQAIQRELLDALGYLSDQVQDAKRLCEAAVGKLKQILAGLSKAQPPIETTPNPFTSYIRPLRLEPNCARFLQSLSRGWFSDSEMVIYDALSRFSAQEVEPSFAVGAANSATSILLENPDKFLYDLNRFSDPLWSFDRDKIPGEHQAGIQGIAVLGVDKRSGRTDSISRQHPHLAVVETGWGNRVLQLQIRAGVPLFALSCMTDLWYSYSRG